MNEGPSPVVTVVVPTRNSVATIATCLRSIREQTVPVETIVVDNHSTDGTVVEARAWGCQIIVAGPERSRQRNIGAKAASCEWVLFLDSDMRLEPEVVDSCLRACNRDDAEAAVVPELATGTGFFARCRALEKECYLGDPDIEAARFFRKETFGELGGYDESITAGGEDWDLPARLIQRGGRITRGEAIVWHLEGRVRLAEAYRTKRYYGVSVHRYRMKHPDRAARQLAPLRPSLTRHWRRLVARPDLAIGLAVLKATELAGLRAGLRAAGKQRTSDIEASGSVFRT